MPRNKVVLHVTEQEANIIVNALVQRPYAEVAQAINNVARQVQQQTGELPTPEGAPKEEKPKKGNRKTRRTAAKKAKKKAKKKGK